MDVRVKGWEGGGKPKSWGQPECSILPQVTVTLYAGTRLSATQLPSLSHSCGVKRRAAWARRCTAMRDDLVSALAELPVYKKTDPKHLITNNSWKTPRWRSMLL